MNATTTKLLVVAGLLLTIAGATRWVRGSLQSDDILMPSQPVTQLPFELGGWQGREIELDPEIARATGADSLINRLYERSGQSPVSMHSAVFANPEIAAIHSPFNCYRGQGYRMISKEIRVPLAGKHGGTIEASFSTWETSQRKVRVLFWYQWGEHCFFDRWGLASVRFRMRGREQWPAVIKVLLETPATDDEKADEERLLSVGQEAFAWFAATSGLAQSAAE